MPFNKKIVGWYSKNKRVLPWRTTQNPYHIWLSEIILQQTRVDQGLPYYEKFVNTYPTVFDLANASEDEVLKLWQGLGYYSRARNLHAAARMVAFDFGGSFPENRDGLLKLKGVGEYTASAIASFCYNEPTAVVDGNVYRVLARYFGIETPVNSTKGIKEFRELAAQLIDAEDPGTYNQAIMEFGAVQCKPQSPDCNICVLNDSCVALKDNMVRVLPVKIKKAAIKKRYFNYLVLHNDEHIALQQRKEKDIWQNLYQFPLIETNHEIGGDELVKHPSFLELVNGKDYALSQFNKHQIIHKLSHQHIFTRFWVVDLQHALPGAVSKEKLENYPMPVLIANFVEEFGF